MGPVATLIIPVTTTICILYNSQVRDCPDASGIRLPGKYCNLKLTFRRQANGKRIVIPLYSIVNALSHQEA